MMAIYNINLPQKAWIYMPVTDGLWVADGEGVIFFFTLYVLKYKLVCI